MFAHHLGTRPSGPVDLLTCTHGAVTHYFLRRHDNPYYGTNRNQWPAPFPVCLAVRPSFMKSAKLWLRIHLSGLARQPDLALWSPSHRMVTLTVPFARILGFPDPAEALARRPGDLTDATAIVQANQVRNARRSRIRPLNSTAVPSCPLAAFSQSSHLILAHGSARTRASQIIVHTRYCLGCHGLDQDKRDFFMDCPSEPRFRHQSAGSFCN